MKDKTTFSKFEQKSRNVRFYSRSLPLIRRILKMLDAGYYPSRIADILGRSKSGIHYHIKKLEKHGFITLCESIEKLKDGLYVKKTKGIITLYNLTQAGSNFLAGIERKARGRVLRLHNVYWLYPILRLPAKTIAWRRVEMTNWTQLLGRELGLRVRKNPRSIEIISEVVEGKDPWEMLFKARDEADRLASHLEQKFDMVLGRSTLSRKPHFGVYDPIAGEYSRHFQLSDDLAKIDESEGCGEIDWLSPESAKSYLLMPYNVETMRRELEVIKQGSLTQSDQLRTLIDSVILLTSSMRDLLDRIDRLVNYHHSQRTPDRHP